MKPLTRFALEHQGRLALKDFTKKHQPTTTDQLLGQTLGKCHDQADQKSSGPYCPRSGCST